MRTCHTKRKKHTFWTLHSVQQMVSVNAYISGYYELHVWPWQWLNRQNNEGNSGTKQVTMPCVVRDRMTSNVWNGKWLGSKGYANFTASTSNAPLKPMRLNSNYDGFSANASRLQTFAINILINLLHAAAEYSNFALGSSKSILAFYNYS